MILFYFNIDGEPVTRAEGIKYFEDSDSRRVAFDKIGDVEISTVFLVINHAFGDGLPILFETMIFGGEYDQEQFRYSTKELALTGHKYAVKLVKGKEKK